MKKHWTFVYLVNRTLTGLYWKFNQDKPWLTKKANQYLDQHLNKEMIGIEFGSGRSTVFFAKRLKKLTSVEHHEEWFSRVELLLKESGIDNVDYKLVPVNESAPYESDYHKILDNYADGSFDFILVDGENRGLCSVRAIHKLKSKGLLVIDNVNWYLPSDSIAPTSVGKNEPPVNENWVKVYDEVSKWKTVWTSNGVTDTAIFIKP